MPHCQKCGRIPCNADPFLIIRGKCPMCLHDEHIAMRKQVAGAEDEHIDTSPRMFELLKWTAAGKRAQVRELERVYALEPSLPAPPA